MIGERIREAPANAEPTIEELVVEEVVGSFGTFLQDPRRGQELEGISELTFLLPHVR